MSGAERFFLAVWLTAAAACCAILFGCAAHTAKVAVPEIIVPRYCIEKVELTPKSECKGPDGKLDCKGILVTFDPSCAIVNVKGKAK